MKYLHTMVRVTDLEASLQFYCAQLGLREVRRKDYPGGRFTLVFLAAPEDEDALLELTHNWDPEPYDGGRNFGHLAYAVDDIYALCDQLRQAGVNANILEPGHVLIEWWSPGIVNPAQRCWHKLELARRRLQAFAEFLRVIRRQRIGLRNVLASALVVPA